MNLSSTGGGGRGSDKGSIIGDVICHGKKKFWTAGGSYHYHHGMAAGENTLDTILCRLLVDSMVKVRKGGAADNKGIVNVDKLVDRYQTFSISKSRKLKTTKKELPGRF